MITTARIHSLVLAAGVYAALLAQAAATTFHPAPASVLSGLTITPGYVDSLYSDQFNAEPGNGGDNTVRSYVDLYFAGSPLVQVGTSAAGNCGGGNTVCTSGPNAGTFSGLFANVFAVHWGGGQGGGDFLAFQYAAAIASFSISGLSNGVSFIRAYCSLSNCAGGGGGNPPQVPLPAAVWLFGTVLAGASGYTGWRRRRERLA